ncbi:MAG: hypothetical protein R6W73_09840 [Candidatus Saliniplasma sp.]
MLKRKRLVAVFIVLLLVVSVFTMLAKPAEGAAVSDEELAEDEYGELTEEYGWLHDVDINGVISDADDEPFNDVFVGQREVSMRPSFMENVTEDVNDEANITHSEIETTEIVRLVGDDWTSDDEDDWEDGSDQFDWITDTVYEDTGEFNRQDGFNPPNEEDFAGSFEFNIPSEATPGIYRLPIDMRITNYSDASGLWYGPHENLEYVWLEISGNAEVEDFDLDPGMEFETEPVNVENVGESDLRDVSLTLDESDLEDDDDNQVTIHNPDDTAYVDSINLGPPDGGNRDFRFTFSVPFDMTPGEYEVDYTIEATLIEDEEEVDIIEHGTIIVTINEIVELSAEIVDNEVTQGTPIQEFTVTFTNTGNLDLERISIRPVEDSAFSIPSDYYENLGAEREDPFIDIGDLDVGESNETEIIIGMDQYMQIGEHKLSFYFDAYHFDSMGEVTGTEGYYRVHNIPEEPDPELPVADTDEPFAWIEVLEPDVALDVDAYDLDSVGLLDMGYQTISVTLTNHGNVEYTDANVELHTEDTPFINPADEEQNTIEMLDEPFSLHGEGDREIRFGVIIDTEFIEDRIEEDQPIYSAGFTMEAVNGDTLEEVELSFTTEGLVSGIGPRLVVTGDTENNNVEAGEEFELTFDIENRGDEPIRSLMVRASPNTSGAEDLDVESFDSGQDAIYFWQAGSPPGSSIWDVEPDDTILYPGENTTVTFHMVSSSDMQEGAIYNIDLEVTGTSEESWETTTTIRTEESDSTKPIMTTQMSYVLVALIIGFFFALGLFLYRKERKPKTDTMEEESSYEQESEEYTYEEPESDEIEPEPSEELEWDEEPEEPPTSEDDIFEEEESQIEPDEREDW